MRYLYLASFVIFLASTASAQSFDNVKAVLEGSRINITYDLTHSFSEETFTVQIFGSHDNYTKPLRLVTGDVGPSIRPGKGKRVQWDVQAELNTFKGDITFELRGLPNLMPLQFRSPTAGGKLKRGKASTIQWRGGRATAQVHINLYQGDKMVFPVTETTNGGTYVWSVPKELKKGSGYYLKMTSGNESITSEQFSIKGKTPFMVKALPVLLAGGAAAFLGGGGGGGGGGGNPPQNSLPEPPDPN